MVKSRIRQRVCFLIAALTAVLFAVSAWITFASVVMRIHAGEETRVGNTVIGDRVSMLDLMDRYPVEYVIGPLDVNPDGSYKAENTAYNPDTGEYVPTNNAHGILASLYFNVENYIYTLPNSDLDGAGRTLYGWKNGIKAVSVESTSQRIDENGYIYNGAQKTEDIGIYLKYGNNNTPYLTSKGKYALIVPDNVTQIGQGNGAYGVKSGDKWVSMYQIQTAPNNFTTVDYGSPSTITDGKSSAFTDFGCFLGIGSAGNAKPDEAFWQPRERLLGVYFTENSNLTTIASGTAASAKAMEEWNRCSSQNVGKSAFARCDNMRFLILPSKENNAGESSSPVGVSTIGNYSFFYCAQLVDANIPSSVTALGDYAFRKCESLLHITVPGGVRAGTGVFAECSKLKDVIDLSGNYGPEAFANSNLFNHATSVGSSLLFVLEDILFCKKTTATSNNEQNIFATISGGNKYYEQNRWYALGIAGKTDETGTSVLTFPEELSDEHPSRESVAYDYLDCDGKKCKNQIGTSADGVPAVNKYDIAKEFANNTWCTNVVIPKAVDVIGDRAFYNSHVRYMETYATVIGNSAFQSNSDVSADMGNAQWFYIHKNKTSGNYVNDYSFGDNAFGSPNVKRYYIFEDKNLYDAVSNRTSLFTGYTGQDISFQTEYLYQIPVYANVYSEDGEQVSISESDMASSFFNDSDYGEATVKQGDNKIIYTKRLSGGAYGGFQFRKLYRGNWGDASRIPNAPDQANPTLSNMSSTVWYTSADYSTRLPDNGVTGIYSSGAREINIFTKKIAKPTLEDKAYTFGDTVLNGSIVENGTEGGKTIGNDSSITFFEALGLNDRIDDYEIEAYSVVNASNGQVSITVTDVQNAGTYSLRVGLNSDKWGVWSSDYVNDTFTANVRVDQKNIEISEISDIPQFKIKDGDVLRGNGDTLYRYSDGWYLTQQNGEDPITTAQITEGYTYYTGNEVEIDLDYDHKLLKNYGTSLDITCVGTKATVSSDNYAIYTFEITRNDWGNYNYNFDPDKFFAGNTDYGITVSARETQRFRISKHWYIVMQTNMFVDNTVENIDDTTAQYMLAEKDGAAIYEWTYEDVVKVNTPKLAYGSDQASPRINISYAPTEGMPVTIVSDTLVEAPTYDEVAGTVYTKNTIGYYINSAMPAGTYTVTISADAVTAEVDGVQKSFNAITNTYIITVLPKALNSGCVDGIHEIMRGKLAGDAYINAYPLDGKALHDDISEEVVLLNNTLNQTKPDANANNYWATEAATQYYDSEAEITYNLEGSGNTIYSNYDTMLGMLASAGEYVLYYSISAKNYVTVGGADSEDRQQKTFTTVLYTDVKVSEFYEFILDADGLYFKDVVYNGSDAHTLVPTSRYYSYGFDDEDYVNVREKASVTLTLYDSTLARWNEALDPNKFTAEQIEAAKNIFAVSEDGKSLTVYYNIVPADNSWRLPPQLNGWTYNGFVKDTNIVVGTLAYPSDTGAELTVYYRIGKLNEDGTYTWLNVGGNVAIDGVDDDSAYFAVDGEGKVEDTVAEKLNGLHRGTYYLGSYVTARADGNVNAYEQTSSYVRVVVGRATNTWTAPPGIVRWTWGEYDRSVNVISASTRLDGADENGAVNDITYTVKKKGSDEACSVVIVAEDGTEKTVKLENFTVVTDDIAAALAALSADDYVLYGTRLGNADYGDLGPTAYEFDIGMANNVFNTTPGFTAWLYRSFTTDKNFTAGVSKYSTDGNSIVYTLSLSTHDEFEFGGNTSATHELLYTADENGDVIFNAAVIAALNALPVNSGFNYVLTATLEGTNDYSDLTYSASFSVLVASNTWDQEPGMTSWAYNSFTVDGNFTAGIPSLKEDAEAVVSYTVSGDNLIADIVLETELVDGRAVLKQSSVDKLNALNKGSYTLSVEYPGTDNYGALTRDITFGVSELNNTWQTTPGMAGWTYHAFAETNFRAGVPTIAESMDGDNAAKVKYTIDKTVITDGVESTDDTFTAIEFTDISAVAEQLNALGAGSYRMTATYAGTDNYAEMSYRVDFTVSPVQNVWLTSPRITSYAYQSFAADSNFIAGVPQYPDSDKKVYYIIADKSVESLPSDELPNTLDSFKISAGDKMPLFTDINDTVTNLNDPALNNKTVTELLNKLSYGTYYLWAFAEGADNYSHLLSSVEFSVTGAANIWNERPAISGWIYNAYNGSFTAGESLFGSVVYTVYYADELGNSTGEAVLFGFEKEDGSTEYRDSLTADELNVELGKLGAGNYRLFAEVEKTDDYDGISYDVGFAVGKAENKWAGGAPIIEIDNNGVAWTYGETAVAPNEAKAEYGDLSESDYTKTYYAARLINGVFTVDYLSPIDGVPVDAGNYAYVVVAKGNADYNDLVSESFFTIAAAENDWTENGRPEDTLTWVWGEDGSVLENEESPNRLINADALHGGDTVVYEIRVANGNIVERDISKSDIAAKLAALGAGTYTISATVPAGNNYDGVAAATTTLTVIKADLEWTEDTDFAVGGYSWTWGVADTGKTLFGVPSAKTVANKTGEQVTVVYNVYSVISGVKTKLNETEIGAHGDMSTFVKALGAGNYEITVVASCDNYNDLSQSVTVAIGYAPIVWSGDPVNGEWEWNNKSDDDKSIGNALTAALADGSKATLTYDVYTNGALKESFTSFDALKSALFGYDRGSYTVIITASAGDNDANYNADTKRKTFTVTVSQAENDWEQGKEPKNISRDYLAELDNVVTPEAKFGTVIISYNNTVITDFAAWVNDVKKNAGEYKFTVAVAADENGNFTGLSETVTLTVVGMGGGWSNAGDLTDVVNFGFDANTFEERMSKIVIPYKNANSELVNETFRYTVSYIPFSGNTQNSGDLKTAAEVTDYLKKIRNLDANFGAGKYIITASYDPHNDNYATLTYTVTVTVDKATIAWTSNEPNYNLGEGYAYPGYQKAYQDFDGIPTPSAGAGHDVKYTVRQGGSSEEAKVVEIGDLAAYLNGLDVGTYYITYSVTETNNYTGLAETTIMVIVNQASISWSNQADLDVRYDSFVDDEEYGIVVPVSPRGAVTLTVTTTADFAYPKDRVLNDANLNEWLKSLNLVAREDGYKLVFGVEGTGNYNALNHTANLYISKHQNPVKADIALSASTVDYGTAVTVTATPEFTYGGDTAVYTLNGEVFTYDRLEEKLSALDSGDYTVIVTVAETDSYLGAISSVSFTVNKIVTAWTNLSDLNAAKTTNADYGAAIDIPVPQINWAEGKIVYSVTVNGKTDDIESGDWKTYIQGKGVGTYLLSAWVNGDANHTDLNAFEITVVISAAGIRWDDDTRNAQKNFTWTWSAEKSGYDAIAKPVLLGEGCTVVYTLSGTGIQNAIEYSDWDKLIADVKAKDAGAYTVTVSVEGSDDNYSLPADLTYNITITQVAVNWVLDNAVISEVDLAAKYANLTVTWGDFDGVLPALTTDWEGKQVIFTHNGVSVSDWNAYLKTLAASDTAYTLTASVQGDANHNGLTFNVTVTVNKKSVDWTENTKNQQKSYSWTWNANGNYSGIDSIAAPALDSANCSIEYSFAVNGTVSAQTSWNGMIAAVKAGGVGTYTITATAKVTVDADKENYALTSTVYTYTFDLSAKSVDWTENTKNAQKSYAWTWSSDKTSYDEIHAPALDDPSDCTIGYTLVSVVGDTTTTLYSGVAWTGENSVYSHLTAQNVGTYRITATVSATSNYAVPADIRYTVTVGKKPVDWTDATKGAVKSFTWTWNASGDYDAVSAPALNDSACAVTYALSGASATYNSWSDVIDVVKGYGIGTYTVTATPTVDNGGNYTLPAAIEYNFEIVSRIIDWTDDTKTANKIFAWTWNKDGEYNTSTVAAPALNDGSGCTVSYVLSGDVTVYNSWDSVLNALKAKNAGEYTVTVSVAADASGSNYKLPAALTYEFVIAEKPVDWTADTKSDNKTFVWTWNEAGNYVAIPAPVLDDAEGGTLSFVLKQSGVTGTIGTFGDWASVCAELAKQTAGSYTVTVSVTGNTNYSIVAVELTYTVTIDVTENGWVKHEGADATVKWTYGNNDNKVIAYEAEHNNENMVILINNSRWNASEEYETLNDYLCSLGVGTYTISVTVPADSKYAGLNETITLTVKLAENSWITIMTLGSDGVTSADGEVAERGWTWDNRTVKENIFGAPIAAVGDEVIITVSRITIDAVETVISATLGYRTEDGKRVVNVNDVTAFLTRLFALDAGAYKIVASVPQSGNYAELADCEVTFDVKQAKNEWVKEPTVGSLIFGSNAPNPESQAKFGSVEKYEYAYAYDEEGNEIAYDKVTVWFDSAPIAAGTYYVRGKVAGTQNYTALEGHSKYTIGAGKNDWVNMPGVIAWSWNGYDKTVNLFSGSARNNGEATFGIRKQVDGEQQLLTVDDFETFEKDAVSTEQRELLNKFALETVKVGDTEVKYVSDKIAEVLNALKPGPYILLVDIAGGESLDDLHGTATFFVSKASNEWKSSPNVLSFVYGNFIESGDRMSFTDGVAKYGTSNVLYRVTGADADGNTVGSNVNGLSVQAVKEFIKSLSAGNYSLQAWVVGGTTYNEFYSDAAPYSVLFNVTRAENDWVTGKAPAESVSVTYNYLHGADVRITDIFAAPEAKTGVTFGILNSEQQSLVSGISYDDLLAELQKLDYGSYFIRSNAEQSCNYTAITENTVFNITRQTNALSYKDDGSAFDANTTALGAWKTNAAGITDNDIAAFREVVAEHGSVNYTYGGNVYDFASICAVMKSSDAGTYNIGVSVVGTNEYDGFDNLVYTLVISPAKNEWLGGWTVAQSITFGAGRDNAPIAWEWSTTVTWIGAKTLYGSTVNVMITSVDDMGVESDALHYYTIDTATNFDAQVANVSRALSSLGAGDYYLTVTAPNTNNWSAINGDTYTDSNVYKAMFSVTKTTDNKWIGTDGVPCDPMLVDAENNSVTKWNYGTSVRAQANAAFGTWQVEYFARNADGSKGNHYAQMPVDAGRYFAVFNVTDTNEYNGIDYEIEFTIDKILYESYAVVPGVVAWTWNEYNRFDNLFTGIARSGGDVSYTILQNGKIAVVDGIELKGIELVDLSGVHHDNDQALNTYVSDYYGDLISKLLADDYTLRVDFAETTNYLDFHPTVDFTIAVARNEWVVVPNVSPWTVNNWNSEDSTPQAISRFGNPTLTITGKAEGKIYYRATYDSELEAYNTSISILNSAPAGWYTLSASVDAADGMYGPNLTSSYDFQIFIQGSLDERNGWAVSPSIRPWIANTDSEFGELVGKPYRGLPYFEFYEAVEVNGVFTMSDTPIGAGADSVTVPAGDTYLKDFYVPMAPGTYYMVAKAEYWVDGKPVESQTIEDTPRMFVIGNRANAFTQDARIPTVLYLGEKDSWKDNPPTAFASLPDSEVTFTYFDANTKAELGTEIPTVPGNYILRATAFAKYSAPIMSEIEFSVVLSQNSWKNDVSPTIDGWSEEFSDSAPDPVGEAKFGTIVYTYVNVLAPDVVLTEKPLTAGTYIMYATVELEGYITLESSYRFTIEEAFDRTFVLIDIILGLVACAFAVVVIIFAIRRYKENG